MTTLAKIAELENRRAAVAKQISAAKKSLRDEERDADKHVKIALGGAVLAFFAQENCPATIRHFLLTKADQGIQKQGLGREKFEILKEKFRSKEQGNS